MATERISASVSKEQAKKLQGIVKRFYSGITSTAISDAITLLDRAAESGKLVPRKSALVEADVQ